MPLRAEIERQLRDYLNGKYQISRTWKVPTVQDIGIGRQGRLIETAILFADMRKSSEIADDHRRQTTAKVYQSFLDAMARVATSESGQIRAYDGDRIMVVFSPERRSPNAAVNKAVRAALKMTWCLRELIAPSLRGFDSIDCGIGIAYGMVLVVKAGLRRKSYDQGLIWIGSPTNLASSLSEIGEDPENIWIDEEVYNRLSDDDRFEGQQPIWQQRMFTFAGRRIRAYSTEYHMEFN